MGYYCIRDIKTMFWAHALDTKKFPISAPGILISDAVKILGEEAVTFACQPEFAGNFYNRIVINEEIISYLYFEGFKCAAYFYNVQQYVKAEKQTMS